MTLIVLNKDIKDNYKNQNVTKNLPPLFTDKLYHTNNASKQTSSNVTTPSQFQRIYNNFYRFVATLFPIVIWQIGMNQYIDFIPLAALRIHTYESLSLPGCKGRSTKTG
jgi:hypothetical protein